MNICSRVAVTEVSVVIWVKEDWRVAAGLKYWSEVQLFTPMI